VYRARTIAVIAVALLTAGCAPQAPVEQVQLFGNAFANVQAATQPLFDDLAMAERTLGQHVAIDDAQAKPEPGATPSEPETVVLAPATVLHAAGATDGAAEQPAKESTPPVTAELPAVTAFKCDEGNPLWRDTKARDSDGSEIGFIEKLCLDDAAYFANVGDPPATSQFRQGLAVLGRYSDVLLTLAEGRNIDQAKADLHALGASIAGAISIIPQAAPVAAGIGPLLTALNPLIEEAAKAQNFAEMRRLVVNADPYFVRLIATLKAGAPAMFDTLIEEPASWVPVRTKNNPELAKAVVQQIEGYRTVVSNFVVLLDELASAHADIVEAIKQAENAPLTLGLAADRAQRLNAQANALRDAFVILRRGPPSTS
jgi:hypothetical protein